MQVPVRSLSSMYSTLGVPEEPLEKKRRPRAFLMRQTPILGCHICTFPLQPYAFLTTLLSMWHSTGKIIAFTHAPSPARIVPSSKPRLGPLQLRRRTSPSRSPWSISLQSSVTICLDSSLPIFPIGGEKNNRCHKHVNPPASILAPCFRYNRPRVYCLHRRRHRPGPDHSV